MFEFEHISRLFDEDPERFFEFFQDSELVIKVRIIDSEDVLAGFPYREGQFLSGMEDDETDQDCTWLQVSLGDATDTDSGQEAWLNSEPRVLEYTIR